MYLASKMLYGLPINTNWNKNNGWVNGILWDNKDKNVFLFYHNDTMYFIEEIGFSKNIYGPGIYIWE